MSHSQGTPTVERFWESAHRRGTESDSGPVNEQASVREWQVGHPWGRHGVMVAFAEVELLMWN